MIFASLKNASSAHEIVESDKDIRHFIHDLLRYFLATILAFDSLWFHDSFEENSKSCLELSVVVRVVGAVIS